MSAGGVDLQMAGARERQHGRVVILRRQGQHAVAQLHQALRLAHEQQLEHAVVHVHDLRGERQNARNGCGVADGAEDIVVLEHGLVVEQKAHMAAADGRQLLDAAEHIGQMAQRIFYAL